MYLDKFKSTNMGQREQKNFTDNQVGRAPAQFGMGCAMDTLCGQAVGAGQLDALGVYVQQSWIICGVAAVALTPAYAFATPILGSLLRQPASVAAAAGPYARWAIPRLLAHAANFPLQKFFQTQSKVWALTAISGAALAVHVALTYLAVNRLGYGLRGAAVAGNISYWLIDAAQFAYLVSGRFPDAWKGFSLLAFSNLAAFVKLSLVSAVMICLEFWYYAALLILVGLLKNGQLQLDIMSVCINYEFWTMMVALGLSEAVSVRVSNELGASRPKEAKFSVAVAATTSAFIGAIFMAVFFIWRRSLPRLFSDDEEVVQGASRLGYLLAVTVFFGSIGPVLSGNQFLLRNLSLLGGHGVSSDRYMKPLAGVLWAPWRCFGRRRPTDHETIPVTRQANMLDRENFLKAGYFVLSFHHKINFVFFAAPSRIT
uniref:Uncharacterized protein n=2 Tax=Avena sativa TaxID=4498 RepID=A0ACD5W4C5_AVESA